MYKLIFVLTFVLCVGTTGQSQAPSSAAPQLPPFSLDELQRRNFLFFWELTDTVLWQCHDRWPTPSFSSIASTGFGLSTYLVGAERGWISRDQALDRVLNTLTVLKNLPQGADASGVAGYKGFFYHFLDQQKGHRFERVELSSIDTGLLMAGILSCMSYFDRDTPKEKALRELADFLFRRVEWDWFLNEHNRLSMGWFPERGFLGSDWRGYNEAMILPIMAMGSPTHAVPAAMWDSWCKPYYWAEYKGQEMVNFGPLFGHQYSHCWIDFRGIQDAYMREKGIDYFENSRRATYANRQYCIDNPNGWRGWGPNLWGLTACDGPQDFRKGKVKHDIYKDRELMFLGYGARGVAADYNEDDGTIAPTAAGASVPFAPEICIPALEHMWNEYGAQLLGPYGFKDAFNPSFTFEPGCENGWYDVDYLGIDQGPIVLMIENYRSGFLWDLMKKNPYIQEGLKKAGFSGGWLGNVQRTKDNSKARPNPDVPVEPQTFFQKNIYKDGNGNQLPYQWMEPAGRQAGKKYPLVVFLHGSGERGNDNVLQMRNGVFAFCEKAVRDKYQPYLIVPQCPAGDRWGGGRSNDGKLQFDADNPTAPGRMVLELIEKMLRENPAIDPDRVYLTGLSMGGFGTFDLLMRRPDLFAAGAPLCGGGDPEQARRIKHIPLWVLHGRLDEAVYPKYSTEMVEALRKAGAKVQYTEYSTMRHDVWNIAYYNPAFTDWLFARKKSAKRQ